MNLSAVSSQILRRQAVLMDHVTMLQEAQERCDAVNAVTQFDLVSSEMLFLTQVMRTLFLLATEERMNKLVARHCVSDSVT